MTNEELEILKVHKNALQSATLFEAYQKAHVAYVAFLIDREEKRRDAVGTYLERLCND